MTENETVGWHHRINGDEFEQTPAESEGQVHLACCSPWGGKESDMTQRLDNNNNQLWLWEKNNSKSKQFTTIDTHFSFTGLSYYNSAQLSSVYLILGFRLLKGYFCECVKSLGQA